MMALWLIVAVIVGLAVFFSKGCAAAFGAVAASFFIFALLALVASC